MSHFKCSETFTLILVYNYSSMEMLLNRRKILKAELYRNNENCRFSPQSHVSPLTLFTAKVDLQIMIIASD